MTYFTREREKGQDLIFPIPPFVVFTCLREGLEAIWPFMASTNMCASYTDYCLCCSDWLMLYWVNSLDLLRHSGEILIQIRHTTSFKSVGFKLRTEIFVRIIGMRRWKAMHSNIFKVIFFKNVWKETAATEHEIM